VNDAPVNEAIGVLRKAREMYKRVYVLFSGGKDSLAVLDLATQVFRPSEMRIVFTEVTGNSDKCNVDYVYRVWLRYYGDYELLHLKRNEDFFEYMLRAGTPGPGARWCMSKFKQSLWRHLSPPIFIVGMKRSDSRRRKLIYRSFFVKNDWLVGTVVLPILNWSTRDVLDYVRSRGLEVSPCYARYGHSGNCMFCPFHSKRSATLTLMDPYWRERILPYLRRVMSVELAKTRFGATVRRKWLENPVLRNVPLTAWSRSGCG